MFGKYLAPNSQVLKNELKISVHSPTSPYDIANGIKELVQDSLLDNKPIVIICIGTDRSTGDSLGPLTGTRLKSISSYPHIYGTLDSPVHATNLADTVIQINQVFHNPYIIAIDACLGHSDSVGFVNIGTGSLRPGAAVNKNLPPIGNLYITGTVNVGGFLEHLVLQSTRLNLVFKMADTISLGLSMGLRIF